MPAKIEYKASVSSDLEDVESSMARRIITKIERALRTQGRSGKPLMGEFAGLYRLRIKDYGVIYARTTSEGRVELGLQTAQIIMDGYKAE